MDYKKTFYELFLLYPSEELENTEDEGYNIKQEVITSRNSEEVLEVIT